MIISIVDSRSIKRDEKGKTAVKLTGKTRVLGIFGDPVAHSLSPVMQNQALQQAGIDAVYVPFHVTAEQLPQAVASIRSLGLWGVNVTVPHKEAVFPLLDDIDPAARLIGAVNTIVNRNGRLIGYNTDGLGFLRSLAEDLHFSPDGRRILLLGAGGRVGRRWFPCVKQVLAGSVLPTGPAVELKL